MKQLRAGERRRLRSLNLKVNKKLYTAQSFAEYLGANVRSRKTELVWYRYLFYVDFYPILGTLEETGKCMGRDHTSVHHGLMEVQKAKETNDKVYLSIQKRYEEKKAEFYGLVKLESIDL